jgi:putative acetyltransferase
MYLKQEICGMGIGDRVMEMCLLKEMEFGFKKIYLEFRTELVNAIGPYTKHGFKRLSSPIGANGHTYYQYLDDKKRLVRQALEQRTLSF